MIPTQDFAFRRGWIVMAAIFMTAIALFFPVMLIIDISHLGKDIPVWGMLLLAAMTAYLAFVAVLFIQRVIQNNPIIRIDTEGIHLGASPFAIPHIPWSSIQGVHIRMSMYLQWLVIDLVDKDELVNSLPKWRQILYKSRLMHTQGMLVFDTPTVLYGNESAVPLSEIHLAIENVLHARRNQDHTYESISEERNAIPLQAGC